MRYSKIWEINGQISGTIESVTHFVPIEKKISWLTPKI